MTLEDRIHQTGEHVLGSFVTDPQLPELIGQRVATRARQRRQRAAAGLGAGVVVALGGLVVLNLQGPGDNAPTAAGSAGTITSVRPAASSFLDGATTTMAVVVTSSTVAAVSTTVATGPKSTMRTGAATTVHSVAVDSPPALFLVAGGSGTEGAMDPTTGSTIPATATTAPAPASSPAPTTARSRSASGQFEYRLAGADPSPGDTATVSTTAAVTTVPSTTTKPTTTTTSPASTLAVPTAGSGTGPTLVSTTSTTLAASTSAVAAETSAPATPASGSDPHGADACGQPALLVNGAPTKQLPARAAEVRLSPDGARGVIVTSACTAPGDPYRVLMFWPDEPSKAPVELASMDMSHDTSRLVPEHFMEFSDDGTRLAVVDDRGAGSFDLTRSEPTRTSLLPAGCGGELVVDARTGLFVDGHRMLALATCSGTPTLLAGQPGDVQTVATIPGCGVAAQLALHETAVDDPMRGWIAVHAGDQTWTVGNRHVYGPFHTTDVSWAPAA